MPAQPKKPPLYPLLKELMAWHLAQLTNRPVLLAGKPLQSGHARRWAQLYREELKAAYGASPSQFDRICAGNSRPVVEVMLRALGYRSVNGQPAPCANADERAQAEWEFIVACGLPANPALHRPVLHAERKALELDNTPALGGHLPAPAEQQFHRPAAAAPSQRELAAASRPVAEVNRPALQREIVRRLSEPGCTAWLRLLALECDQSGLDGPRPQPSQLRTLVDALGAQGVACREDPLHAISRSLIALHRQQGTLDVDSLAAVQAAARGVFALCLIDYVVAMPASRSTVGAAVLTSPTSEILAAVALLDDVLGHVTEFERPASHARQPGPVVQVDVRDLMTVRDHAPGVLPGRAGEATRGQIIGWLLPYFEARDGTGFGSADGSETAPVSDAQLRTMLQTFARVRGRRLRAALDLSVPDAPARLDLLRQQAQQFGLSFVAFGPVHSADPAGSTGGRVHADLQSLEILVADFLTHLEALIPHFHDTRHA